MRVVLDTNTVISALLWGGTPKRFLDLAVEAGVEILASSTLVEELERVLIRKKFSARLAKRQVSAGQIIHAYRELIAVIAVTVVPAPKLRDPKDHHVVAAAVAAQAHLLVTGDRDLLELKDYEGIRIVSPAEALIQFERR